MKAQFALPFLQALVSARTPRNHNPGEVVAARTFLWLLYLLLLYLLLLLLLQGRVVLLLLLLRTYFFSFDDVIGFCLGDRILLLLLLF